jgi:hypothetical protein
MENAHLKATKSMKNVFTGMAVVCLSALSLSAQVCDPSTAPTGLVSTYTPGGGFFSGA